MRKLNYAGRSIALLGLAGWMVIAPLVELLGVAQTVVQNGQNIDAAIAEGDRLFREGSAESLRKAIVAFERALQLSRTAKALDKQALSAVFLGRIYSNLGEQQKALKYYNQSLPLYRAVEDRDGEATTLNNIGIVYDALGEQQKALEYYNQSLPQWRVVGDRRGEAMTLNNIGKVYFDLREQQKALEYYNQSLLLSHAVGDRSGEARTLTNIGGVYSALGEQQKALEYLNQALPQWRAVGDRGGEATTLNHMGSVYYTLGEQQKALEYLNQALPLYRVVGDRGGEARTLNNIGFVYSSALGEQQKGLDYYNQALPLYRVVGDRGGEAGTLNNVAFLLADQKQPELAIALYKQSVNVYESIRQDNQKLPKELRESYAKSISYTYQGLADLLIKQGRLPEAQAVLELLKLKELNTYTRNARTPNTGIRFTDAEQKALTEFLLQYGTAANFDQQISQCEETNCTTLKQLRSQRDQVNIAIRKMLDRLRITLKDQVIDISKLNTEEFNQAARNIVNAQPGTVLIYPIVTETKIQFLLAFKAGAGDEAAVTLRAIDGANIKSEDLFNTTQQLRQALADPTSDLKTLQAKSQQLYTWLIQPLEAELQTAKHLVFVSDRATRHIPLAALYDGKDYLINKPYTLTTILAAKTTDAKTPQPKTPNVLAVGATQFKTAPALEYVASEISAIVQTPQTQQGIFPGLPYLNAQFTFDNLKDSLNGHNILHIATHGKLDPFNIDNSYLLTSSGEKIDKDKISLLQDYGLGSVHLVVLSACDTGTGGKTTEGLEVAGMSHYFMQSGAKSVIASLWQVNDPATALFMQQFYQHLKAGKTKAQAIQQVQTDFI
ncbi:tetratricopeptide repeat protein [Leptolyngbya boryana CZ1]|uniref:Tetratricopeptide repeat protein n=1 Tax=Leptolyngbya boryana CZ1 TaxID=3060204 RepID=A0AA97AUA6_LEPBY|nr:tetratricopeptide repeat protein [Leptolyngbya boryana]WNZ44081.1 tetratricopeptide repeat protein [Leptolyngbya boryana CZ1]